jgi:lipooligosaccharide transport system ATP-binding protein
LIFAALEHKAEAKILELSGGMQRRLTLARALVNRPDLVILDEPTTGLDPQARHVIWQRLRQLTGQGATLILTTHYMEEAQRLCDRLAIMDNGRILAEGSPRDLIQTHIEPYVVEIHDAGIPRWLRERTVELVDRVELVGETLFCYLREEEALLAELRQHNDLQYLYRPANLEDVFLKLTGREMRDK